MQYKSNFKMSQSQTSSSKYLPLKPSQQPAMSLNQYAPTNPRKKILLWGNLMKIQARITSLKLNDNN